MLLVVMLAWPGVPQAPLTTILSILQPAPVTLVSEAIRKRSLIDCPNIWTKVRHCVDIATRALAPRHSAANRIRERSANRPVITACYETSAYCWIGNVCECAACNIWGRNFEDGAIEIVHAATNRLESIVITEADLGPWACDWDVGCIETFVAHDAWVVNESVVRRRIRRSGGRDPENSIGVRRIGCHPARG